MIGDWMFTRAKEALLNGSLGALTAGTYKVMLLNSDYVGPLTAQYVSEIVAHEITAAGYARQTLTGRSLTRDDTNFVETLDANDVTFAGLASGQTIRAAVAYKFGTNDADSLLVFNYDMGDLASGGDFPVVWAPLGNGGLMRI
jgi:hypothetical protein